MARQHDLVINRLLANYLINQLESGDYSTTRLEYTIGAANLCRDDINEIIKSAKRRAARLEAAASPLGPFVRNWVNDLGEEYNAAPNPTTD